MARQPFDCLTCDKFHPHREDKREAGGSCRAHPPTPFMMAIGAKVTVNPLTQERMQEPIIQSGASYPGVGKGDYCHEHPAARAFVMPLLKPGAGDRLGSPDANAKRDGRGFPIEDKSDEAAGEEATAALNKPQGEA